MGMMTSLINGSASRETCTQGPLSSKSPLPSSTMALRRLALLRMPIGTRDRGDLASVIEEGVGIADFRLETELVRDFGKPIPIIVDQDLIEDIIAELKEVGAAGWLLQRDIVADQGDRV